MCFTRAEYGGSTASTCWQTLFIMQPKVLLAVFAARAYCCLVYSLVSTRTPRSFTAKLLSSPLGPSLRWWISLSLPRWKIWHFHLLNWYPFCLFSEVLGKFRALTRPSPEHPGLTTELAFPWVGNWVRNLLTSLPAWITLWFSDTCLLVLGVTVGVAVHNSTVSWA